MDLDHFRQVNDSEGHLRGDRSFLLSWRYLARRGRSLRLQRRVHQPVERFVREQERRRVTIVTLERLIDLWVAHYDRIDE